MSESTMALRNGGTTLFNTQHGKHRAQMLSPWRKGGTSRFDTQYEPTLSAFTMALWYDGASKRRHEPYQNENNKSKRKGFQYASDAFTMAFRYSTKALSRAMLSPWHMALRNSTTTTRALSTRKQCSLTVPILRDPSTRGPPYFTEHMVAAKVRRHESLHTL